MKRHLGITRINVSATAALDDIETKRLCYQAIPDTLRFFNMALLDNYHSFEGDHC